MTTFLAVAVLNCAPRWVDQFLATQEHLIQFFSGDASSQRPDPIMVLGRYLRSLSPHKSTAVATIELVLSLFALVQDLSNRVEPVAVGHDATLLVTQLNCACADSTMTTTTAHPFAAFIPLQIF